MAGHLNVRVTDRVFSNGMHSPICNPMRLKLTYSPCKAWDPDVACNQLLTKISNKWNSVILHHCLWDHQSSWSQTVLKENMYESWIYTTKTIHIIQLSFSHLIISRLAYFGDGQWFWIITSPLLMYSFQQAPDSERHVHWTPVHWVDTLGPNHIVNKHRRPPLDKLTIEYLLSCLS